MGVKESMDCYSNKSSISVVFVRIFWYRSQTSPYVQIQHPKKPVVLQKIATELLWA